MIVETSNECKVIYQYEDDEPELFGNPAIIVNKYCDCIGLESVNGSININRSTIPELIRVLKAYQKS